MKYKGSIIIDKPIEQVAALFADQNNNGEWQEGFVRKELLSGTEGQVGAKSMIYLKQGKREMELKETIMSNDLPYSMEGFYEHKHMDNSLKATFTAINENQTQYENYVEYSRINWVMPKLMAILFPSMFRKQGEKWMQNFKAFVERQ